MSAELGWTEKESRDPKTLAALSPDAARRTEPWVSGAGFGMFIHGDHASQQVLETSWPRVGGIKGLSCAPTETVAEYHRSAATVDPQSWDPVVLAKKAAVAGMHYAVFTARHHGGWSSWPSKASSRTIASFPD